MVGGTKDIVMTVKYFNVRPGYGKLKNEEYKDVFIHKSYIEDCGGQITSDGDKLLVPGQTVRCDLIANPKKPGSMMAINVRLCSTEESSETQVIEQDLRGEVSSFDPARQSGILDSRHYGRLSFKASDFNGPPHLLVDRPYVSFNLVRRRGIKMAVNLQTLGGAAAKASDSSKLVIERAVLGEVIRIKNTFGFIKAGSRTAFFHLSEIKHGITVRVGQIVRFDLTPGAKGPDSFAAVNISIVTGPNERATNRRPGSRAGSTASQFRRQASRQKTEEDLDKEENAPDALEGLLHVKIPRDYEEPEPVPKPKLSRKPQRRIAEKIRNFEDVGPELESEPQLYLESQRRKEEKLKEDEETFKRYYEEQQRAVASRFRKSVGLSSKNESTRPTQRPPSPPLPPERPSRDSAALRSPTALPPPLTVDVVLSGSDFQKQPDVPPYRRISDHIASHPTTSYPQSRTSGIPYNTPPDFGHRDPVNLFSRPRDPPARTDLGAASNLPPPLRPIISNPLIMGQEPSLYDSRARTRTNRSPDFERAIRAHPERPYEGPFREPSKVTAASQLRDYRVRPTGVSGFGSAAASQPLPPERSSRVREARIAVIPVANPSNVRPTFTSGLPNYQRVNRSGVQATRRNSNSSSSNSSASFDDSRPVRRRSPSPPPRRRPSIPPYVNKPDPTRIDENRECRICGNKVVWPLKTPCTHIFCRTCIEKWLKLQPTCPLPSCQKDITLQDLEPAV